MERGLWRAALPVGEGEGRPVACSLTWLESLWLAASLVGEGEKACGVKPHLAEEGEAGLWFAALPGWREKAGLWRAIPPPHLVGEQGPGLWRAASPNWIRGVRTFVRSLTWLKRRRQTFGMLPHLVEEGVPGLLRAASPG